MERQAHKLAIARLAARGVILPTQGLALEMMQRASEAGVSDDDMEMFIMDLFAGFSFQELLPYYVK